MTWSDERQPGVEGEMELPAIFGETEQRAPLPRPIATAAAILGVTGIAFTIFPNGMLLGFALWQSFDGFKLFLIILALLPAMFLRCEASDLLHRIPSARRRAPITMLWITLLELGVLWIGVRVFNGYLTHQPFTIEGFTTATERIPAYIPLGIFAAITGVLIIAVYRLLNAPEALAATLPPAAADTTPAEVPPAL
jgi:hypothetical protein